jgi:ectoine hydrolase
MRRAARISEKIVDGILARVEPGLPKNEARGRDPGRRGARGGRALGRLCRDRAAAALGGGRLRPAPDMGRAALRHRRGDVLRDLRLLPPLPRALLPDAVPGQAAAACWTPKALVEGLEAGLEAARPGNTAGDVARALHGALNRAGIPRTARCGYGIGLSYPPDWGERTVSFRETDGPSFAPA